MPRTADHVLFGRADLAGDATDAAHRPPMVELGGPRPDRGGSPLPPTFIAGCLRPFATRPLEASPPPASLPPPSSSPRPSRVPTPPHGPVSLPGSPSPKTPPIVMS